MHPPDPHLEVSPCDVRSVSDQTIRHCRLVEAAAAATFAVPVAALHASSRCGADIAFARQAVMYLAHVSLGLSHRAVGEFFRRDRTTVAYACRVVEDARTDPTIDRTLAMLEAVCSDSALGPLAHPVQL